MGDLGIRISLHELFVVHREGKIDSANIVPFREKLSPLFRRDLEKCIGDYLFVKRLETSSLQARIQMSTSSCFPAKTFIMW